MNSFPVSQVSLSRRRVRFSVSGLVAVAAAAFTAASPAQSIPVGNYSFETPDIPFFGGYSTSSPDTDPTPWGFTGIQDTVGAFDNTAEGQPDHVDNAIGNQMAFLFAGTGSTLFQQLGATFDIGQSYVFTIAAGGNLTLPDDAVLQLRFYYLDEGNNKVTAAVEGHPYDPSLNPGYITHLFDYSVTLPTVQASDPWAGKTIGIEIAGLGTPESPYPYWDLDNARVAVVPEPGTGWLALIGAVAGAGIRRRRVRG